MAGVAVLLVLAILVSGYRLFSRASRLERPENFVLRPSDPESLIGRKQDLNDLFQSVRESRLFLLDGESGCGKSALVGAGLIPLLQSRQSLLPVLVRDWRVDWEQGPLVEALDSLYQEFSAVEREKLGWSQQPYLAGEAPGLAAELELRLRAVRSSLGRTPLLVADQFDDYQARHPARFLDEHGNWLRPDDLMTANSFWHLVATLLREPGQLHVLIVTRSDTAAGCSCVRFVGEAQTRTRTLRRIDIDHLRPLLASIAPDAAVPAVVSNPANGWHELRERLEADLQRGGAILMQQVQTVLMGLRALPVLSPRAYAAAGSIQGVEGLFIW